MKYVVLLLALVLGAAHRGGAAPIVRVQLRVEPATHAFTCRYTFTLPATDTASVLRLNLSRQWQLQAVRSSAGVPLVRPVYYPYFGDTLQQVLVRYPAAARRRQLTLTYAGTLDKNFATAQVLEFSGHTNWLPFRPGGEYELVEYTLEVRTPAAYQVRSTVPARRGRRGHYLFEGRTSAIELTAVVARQFQQLAAGPAPAITVVKAGAPLLRQDSALLHKAEDIIAFYNRTIGPQDPIARFTIFLPGTDRDAFGLLDNATVITYPEFDVAERQYLLILAHEISHKWWGYGSVHSEDDWLNEAFATYSSLLYLKATGDEAGYRVEYERRAQTTPGTPAILGFDRFKYEGGMYRRVIYNKGTVVLAALHARLGTAQFYALLAATAAQKVSTTAGFLRVVAQVAGQPTSTWLLAELRR